MEITTKSGYVITIKRNYLVRGESQQIKALSSKVLKSDKIKAEDLGNMKKAEFELDLSVQFVINDRIFEMLTECVHTPDGQEIKANILEWVNTQLKDTIGDELIDAVIQEVNRTETVSGEKNNAVVQVPQGNSTSTV